MPRGISTQVLGGFKTGMDRQTKRGGKDGAQRLYTLENAYLNERGDAVPRPGLQHVANVAHSSGLYGWQGQLHVFHGEDDFVDPGNPLVAAHWVRYPYVEQPLTLSGDLPGGIPGSVVDFQYTIADGVPPYVVSITAGALPDGLIMSASGRVTGTRTTKGSYSWTVSATDLNGDTVPLNDSSATADTIDSAIAEDVPLLHWPLNETSGAVANDLSGNGYNGTYTGGTLTGSGFTMTTWTDHVMAATGSAGGSPLDVGTGRQWSVEAVVTRGATQPFDNVSANIAAQWRSPNLGYVSMGLCMPSTGKVATSFMGYFTPSDLSSSRAVSSAAAPVNGARTHVYMERVQGTGATDTLNIYLNGVLSQTASVASTLVGTASNGAQFCVGFYPNFSYGWLGTVEHVAVYNHALGAARVLYHAQLLGLA